MRQLAAMISMHSICWHMLSDHVYVCVYICMYAYTRNLTMYMYVCTYSCMCIYDAHPLIALCWHMRSDHVYACVLTYICMDTPESHPLVWHCVGTWERIIYVYIYTHLYPVDTPDLTTCIYVYTCFCMRILIHINVRVFSTALCILPSITGWRRPVGCRNL